MAATREMLEGEAYWGRIRLIKQKLYILEAILIVIIAVILIFFYGEFQDNPFFIAFDRLLWFAFIMLLVIEVESFVFRIMQIRIARTFSTKHLMTNNSIRRAIVIMVVAVIGLIVFALPSSIQFIEEVSSHTGSVSYIYPAQFLPGDPLGLSEVSSISLHSDLPVDVYIVSKQDYVSYAGQWDALRNFCLNGNATHVNTSLTIVIPSMNHQYLYLLVDPTTTEYEDFAVISYTLHVDLSSTLTTFLPLMCIVFIAANGAWIGYLVPLSRKYAMNSIYK